MQIPLCHDVVLWEEKNSPIPLLPAMIRCSQKSDYSLVHVRHDAQQSFRVGNDTESRPSPETGKYAMVRPTSLPGLVGMRSLWRISEWTVRRSCPSPAKSSDKCHAPREEGKVAISGRETSWHLLRVCMVSQQAHSERRLRYASAREWAGGQKSKAPEVNPGQGER